MSNSLKPHDPAQNRVFKLSNLGDPLPELNSFLSQHVSMVILGAFPESELIIPIANRLCTEGSKDQAILWVKNPDLQAKVAAALRIDAKLTLAAIFKKHTQEVVYSIPRNPASTTDRISPGEMIIGFKAALESNNNPSLV